MKKPKNPGNPLQTKKRCRKILFHRQPQIHAAIRQNPQPCLERLTHQPSPPLAIIQSLAQKP